MLVDAIRGAEAGVKRRSADRPRAAPTLRPWSAERPSCCWPCSGPGVFLAGLELMITAVALPSILASLVDPNGSSAWIELRKASWIINGYLLVYILTMPMAGRLTDLWGARRLLIGALVVFIVGSVLAGMAQSLDQLIAARLVQAVGWRRARPGRDGGGVAPVRRDRAAAGARRHRRTDVPRDGRRTVRRGRHPVVGPRRGRAGRRRPGQRTPGGPAGAVVALDLLHQRPDRASSRSCWPGPSRPAGTRPVGPVAWTSSARPCSASRCSPAWSA